SPAASQLTAPWIIERRKMVNLPTSALFVSATGERIHPNTVRWVAGRIGQWLGMELTPQMLRSTFVSNIAGKVDMETLEALSGIHSVSRMSQFLPPRLSADGSEYRTNPLVS